MSLTQWLTRSVPTVWCIPSSKATFSLVPTPSAELTRMGFFQRCMSSRKSAPKPPMPPSTLRLKVFCARYLMRSLAGRRCVMSTPGVGIGYGFRFRLVLGTGLVRHGKGFLRMDCCAAGKANNRL